MSQGQLIRNQHKINQPWQIGARNFRLYRRLVYLSAWQNETNCKLHLISFSDGIH